MILLTGIPTEPPLARVRHELERLNVPVVLFNQRNAARRRSASSSTRQESVAS